MRRGRLLHDGVEKGSVVHESPAAGIQPGHHRRHGVVRGAHVEPAHHRGDRHRVDLSGLIRASLNAEPRLERHPRPTPKSSRGEGRRATPCAPRRSTRARAPCASGSSAGSVRAAPRAAGAGPLQMILIADDCALIAVDKVRVPLLLPRAAAWFATLRAWRQPPRRARCVPAPPWPRRRASFLADLLSRGVLGPRLVGMGRTNPRGNAARGRTFQDGRALGALEVAVSVQPDGRDVLGLGDG